MKKGQVEIVAIVGILVVAVVAVFFAWQSFAPPTTIPALSAEQQVVGDAVNTFMTEGAQSVISTMAQNGGYLSTDDFPSGSVVLNGKPAPYWLLNGQVNVPDFRTTFLQGMTQYVNDNKGSLAQALSEQDVTFGDPLVSADVQPSKITITLNMPTTMKGSPVPQPYQVEVATKMAEAFEFGAAFANYEATNRFMEYSTISGIALSPLENNVQAVPLSVYLIECGEVVYKSWFDVRDSATDVIESTLSHVFMPGKVPLNTSATSPHLKYSLPAMAGKEYQDLDVAFFTPDGFELDRASFQYTPEINAVAVPIPMTSVCRSDPLVIQYYLNYPFITSVRDPLTGSILRFAGNVYIKDTLPGNWADVSTYVTTEQQSICEDALCTASVTVEDSSGNPIEGAQIEYMGCLLGNTDSSGELSATSPCGSGQMRAFAPGYADYRELTTNADMTSKTVTMNKNVFLRMNFYEVHVQNMSTADGEQYWIEAKNTDELGGIDYVNANPARANSTVTLAMNDHFETTLDQKQFMFNTRQGNVFVDAGSYTVSAGLVTPEFLPLGNMMVRERITDDLDGQELHVYIPTILGFEQITELADAARSTNTLTNVLEACGIGPISRTTVNLENLKVAIVDSEGGVTCS